jgi:hypothetical protein
MNFLRLNPMLISSFGWIDTAPPAPLAVLARSGLFCIVRQLYLGRVPLSTPFPSRRALA